MSTFNTIIRFQLDQNKARLDRELAKRNAVREAEAARSGNAAEMTAQAMTAPVRALALSAAAPPSGCSESTATHRGVAAGRSV